MLSSLLSVVITVPMGYMSGGYDPVAVAGSLEPLKAIEVTLWRASAFEYRVENRTPGWATDHYFGLSPIWRQAESNFGGVHLRVPSGAEVLRSTSGFTEDADAGVFDWNVQLAPYDGTVDFEGPSGATSPYLSVVTMEFFTITDPTVLALFHQTVVRLETRRLGGWWASGSGALTHEIDGWSGARIHLRYVPQ